MLKDELNKLTTNDTYSLILFIVYELRQIPEYSVLSDLIYVLDKDTLVDFINYFGGMTITIPTNEQLQLITKTLLVYQYVNLENHSILEALQKVAENDDELKQKILNIYNQVCEVIEKYHFGVNENA